jgi:hypothetical protein
MTITEYVLLVMLAAMVLVCQLWTWKQNGEILWKLEVMSSGRDDVAWLKNRVLQDDKAERLKKERMLQDLVYETRKGLD